MYYDQNETKLSSEFEYYLYIITVQQIICELLISKLIYLIYMPIIINCRRAIPTRH